MNIRSFRPAALRRWALRSQAFLASALVAWACQDSTGPTARPDDGAAPRLGQASAFYCSTRTATANGMQDGRIPLNFPPDAQAADGSVMEYRYRRQTPSGALAYSADCVIPRTMPAVEMMNQRFKVPADLGRPMGRNRKGDEFTTQGCVADGECTLEPIAVVAPPPPSICDVNCDGGGGGTSPGYTGEAGGGGGEGGETYVDDEDWDCHTEAGCVLRSPSSAEWDLALAATNRINADKDPFCGRIQSNARDMLNRHFQVWDQKITGSREDGSTGTVIGDVHWTSSGAGMHLWSGAIDGDVIAHESMHGMYWPDDAWPMGHTGVYGGRTMSQWQTFCTT